jgi:catechol 2,3-dioxygenase-like lactoylglutathione lyase family enzyme
MKRFHVHVSVRDLDESIRFYSGLFGRGPVVTKPDYAKWMLEDPRLNFAISTRSRAVGIDHIGLQVDTAEELGIMRGQLERADAPLVEQAGAACCYARSDKYWVRDPSGIAWETFHSHEAVATFGDAPPASEKSEACCVPLARVDAPESASCCTPAQKGADTRGGCCA